MVVGRDKDIEVHILHTYQPIPSEESDYGSHSGEVPSIPHHQALVALETWLISTSRAT